MKKIILLIVLIMCFSISGCAQDKQKSEEQVDIKSLLEWKSISGGVELTEYKGTMKVVEVPEIIEGKKVISIGEAFSGNTQLEELILPKSVEYLNLSKSLGGCESLKIIRAGGIKNNGFGIGLSNIKEYDSKIPNLKELYLPNLKGTFSCSFNGYYSLSLDILEIPKVTKITGNISAKKVVLSDEIKYYSCSTSFESYSHCAEEASLVTESSDDRITEYRESIWDEYKEKAEVAIQHSGFGTCVYFDVEIEKENAAAIYCRFFQNDTVTVNGVTYRK